MLAIRLTAWLRPALTVAATAAMLALTACGGGSGAPNNPYEPTPPTAGPLVVVPAEAAAATMALTRARRIPAWVVGEVVDADSIGGRYLEEGSAR